MATQSFRQGDLLNELSAKILLVVIIAAAVLVVALVVVVVIVKVVVAVAAVVVFVVVPLVRRPRPTQGCRADDHDDDDFTKTYKPCRSHL